MRSISWPSSVWNVTCVIQSKRKIGQRIPRDGELESQEGTHLVEELEEVDVVLLLPEVLLEEVVDGGLEHEGVVDGDVADAVLFRARARQLVSSPRSEVREGARRGRTTRYQHG